MSGKKDRKNAKGRVKSKVVIPNQNDVETPLNKGLSGHRTAKRPLLRVRSLGATPESKQRKISTRETTDNEIYKQRKLVQRNNNAQKVEKKNFDATSKTVQDEDLVEDQNEMFDNIQVMVTASEDEFQDESDSELDVSEAELDESASDLKIKLGKGVGRGTVSSIATTIPEDTAATANVAAVAGDPNRIQEMVNDLVMKTLKMYGVDAKEPPNKETPLQKTTGRGLIKLPSDTTLYRPALRQDYASGDEFLNAGDNTMVEKISNFVESMRIEATKRSEPSTSTSNKKRNDNEGQSHICEQLTIKDIAQKEIVQAEKFKADVAAPKGMCDDDNDDDFFHITCHIDEALALKIEKGEFIDLELLLPKEKGGCSNYLVSPDNRIEFVNRDGATYFVPAADDRDNKIRTGRERLIQTRLI